MKAKDNDSIEKLFIAYLHGTDESALGRLLVEGTILLSASRNDASQVLRDAAKAYKVTPTPSLSGSSKRSRPKRSRGRQSDPNRDQPPK
jgi:hypothetical protein